MNPCPVCEGKCCRNDFGYRVKHLAAEFYTHVCDYCDEGAAPLVTTNGVTEPSSAGKMPLADSAARVGCKVVTPDRPGLWLRKQPGRYPEVVRVSANVNVYDGPRLPLAWCPTDDLADYKDVRCDNWWVCEILPDDVPYESMVDALRTAVTAIREKQEIGDG